jgi:transcriptional regulator with XRE-family HTH domain
MSIHNNIPFWQRTKGLLRVRKITQEQFAVSINLHYATFRSWIRRGLLPDADTTLGIANALGVSVGYLINGIDETRAEKQRRERSARKTTSAKMKKFHFRTRSIEECFGQGI